MALYKNKASQKIAVFAVDATGAAKTGDAANITAQISKDGGACAATNDTNPTELDATNAKGIYLFDATQAETNADLIIVSPVSSTSGVTLRPVIIYTEPEIRSADMTAISGDSTAADNAESFFDGTGYAGTNNVIPTVTTVTNAPSDSSGVTELLTRVPDITVITGAVATDVGNSATTFKTTLSSSVDNFYNDCLIVMTSGDLAGQVKKITDYDGTNKIVACGAFTGTPADGVTFVVVNK